MLARHRSHTRRWSYVLALAGAALWIMLLGVLFAAQINPRLAHPTPAGSPSVPIQDTAMPDLPPPSSEPTPQPTQQGSIYVISNVLRPNVDGIDILDRRVHVLDARTLQPLALFAGSDSAVLAPGGSRLYVADGEQISAIDVGTEQTRWTAAASGRLLNDSVATSPNGRWLYVALHASDMHVSERASYQLQIVNTETGEVLPETITFPGCGGVGFLAPRSGDLLYVTCGGDMHQLDTTTQQAKPFPLPVNASSGALAGWSSAIQPCRWIGANDADHRSGAARGYPGRADHQPRPHADDRAWVDDARERWSNPAGRAYAARRKQPA